MTLPNVYKAIVETASRYKIRVVDCSIEKPPNSVDWGPQYCGLDYDLGEVYYARWGYKDTIISEADLLHELVHVIVGPISSRLCEGFALLPFEWALLEHVVQDVPTDERNAMIISANTYQAGTDIFDPHARTRMYVDQSYRDHALYWQDSLGYARALGLLDRRNRPTFRTAAWTPRLVRLACRVTRHSYRDLRDDF